MKSYKFLSGILLIFCALVTNQSFAQGGDQILDGIGETGLVARYLFNGDARDWSRNNLHGTIQGSDFGFVPDSLFGNVLSLPGDGETFISIPGRAVSGEESLSVTGWILMRSAKTGQTFFDFGKNGKSHFFASPAGTSGNDGFRVQILNESAMFSAGSLPATINKWNHLAVVIDAPSKTLSTYINGVRVSQTENLAVELEQLFDNSSEENNKLFIGKSLGTENTYLNARLADFRIYRIPLSERQIARIYNIALKKEESPARRRPEPERNLPSDRKECFILSFRS